MKTTEILSKFSLRGHSMCILYILHGAKEKIIEKDKVNVLDIISRLEKVINHYISTDYNYQERRWCV